jgi:hypothetical protein
MNISLTSELEKFVVKDNQTARLPQPPKTLVELEAQLLQSIDQLDQGQGEDGEKVIRRLRKRMKEARA